MKRRILSIALVVVLSLSVFAGCGLVTTNENRLGEEAVVTIGTGDNEQVVTRSEVINAFNSYGQMYIQFGMSEMQVLQMIISNLSNPKVVVYLALENLEAINDVNKDSVYDVFLTDEELAKVEIDIDNSISGLIDSYEKQNLTADIEDVDMPVYRATPSGFQFVSKVPIDFEGTSSRASAVSAFERSLSNAEMTYESYRDLLSISLKQNLVSEKYQDSITDQVEATDADVMVRYNSMNDKETEQYILSPDSFQAKIEAISENKAFSGENFILNVPVAGYGYAMNLLIGYDEETKAKMDAIDKLVKKEELTEEESSVQKAALFSEITATDERMDWLKQYGSTSDLFEEYAFDGKSTPTMVDGIHVMGENGEYTYETLESNEYTINEFKDKLQTEMNASKANVIDGHQMYKTDGTMTDTFMELMWAYNDDTAANGNGVGYASYANPEDSSYVEEYAKASSAVIEAGVGSYTVVASEFGWHVLYCVEAYNTVGVENVYTASEKNTEGTFSNLFYNSVNDAIKNNHFQTVVSDAQINKEVEVELHEKVLQSIFS